MAGISRQTVSVETINDNTKELPYADALQAKSFNLSGGLSAMEYNFTKNVSYAQEVVSVNGVNREVWYIWDHDDSGNQRHKVAASAFFKHDENGKNFSGFEGTDALSLVKWLAGKKLVRTEQSADEWGAKFEKGDLVSQNTNLGNKRFYYKIG